MVYRVTLCPTLGLIICYRKGCHCLETKNEGSTKNIFSINFFSFVYDLLPKTCFREWILR